MRAIATSLVLILGSIFLPHARADHAYQSKHIDGQWKHHITGERLFIESYEGADDIAILSSPAGTPAGDYTTFNYRSAREGDAPSVPRDLFIHRYFYVADWGHRWLSDYYYVDPANPNRLISNKRWDWHCPRVEDPECGIAGPNPDDLYDRIR